MTKCVAQSDRKAASYVSELTVHAADGRSATAWQIARPLMGNTSIATYLQYNPLQDCVSVRVANFINLKIRYDVEVEIGVFRFIVTHALVASDTCSRTTRNDVRGRWVL